MVSSLSRYTDARGTPYAHNVGPIIRALLNGVKHTADSFAKIHGLDAGYLEEVMQGKQPPTKKVIEAIDRHSPLRLRDLYDPAYRNKVQVRDDTTDGVIVMSAEQRKATERVFERGPSGAKVPYYRYADTAMSTTSLFRPEWIEELYVHEGIGNLHPWGFNKGHFEHQMTYFIGTVSFHWIDNNGHQYVRQMKTGDTNYITPFVPHSFTTREDGNGLILAVTYGGAIATDEFQSRIKSMSIEEYMEFIKRDMPVLGQLATDEHKGVIVQRYEKAAQIKKSPYLIRLLIEGVPYQEHTSALEYIVNNGKDTKSLDIRVDADRWGYNIGNAPVLLVWQKHEAELEPGSSFLIQPNVAHAFRVVNSEQGRLVVMQTKPSAGKPLEELALIGRYAGDRGLRRVHTETTQWF